MHELLLSASVPSSRQSQILNILVGLAAMAPHPILERHLLYRPQRQPQRTMQQLGASQDIQDPSKMARLAQQSGDLYSLRLVEDWLGLFTVQNGHYKAFTSTESLDDENEETNGMSYRDDGMASEEAKAAWQIRFYDVPAPGKRPVTSRGVSIVNISNQDGALAFMDGLGYRFLHSYMVEGHQFINNNVVLFLYRILRLPDLLNAQPRLSPQNRPSKETLKPLDESGGWTLEATVKISDSGNPEFMTQATNELTALREQLRGCLDLRPVDRLALDTRIK